MKSEKLISDFVKYLKSKKKSASTVLAYSKDLSQLAEKFGDKDLSQLNANEIREFIDNLGLTPKTISRKINSFRTFYKYMIDTGKHKANPAMEISHPKVDPNAPRILSPVEYLALRQVSKDNRRLYTMIELMLQTGIRIGEISRLRLTDVELHKTKGTLNIQAFSTNPARTIELNSKAVEALNDYIVSLPKRATKNSPLFATRDNKPIIIRNIRSSIDRAIDKAGIKNACINDLRNTFIVYQLEKGVPIEKVTEIVGHKSKATTSRYLNLLSHPYTPKATSRISEL